MSEPSKLTIEPDSDPDTAVWFDTVGRIVHKLLPAGYGGLTKSPARCGCPDVYERILGVGVPMDRYDSLSPDTTRLCRVCW